MPLFPNFFPSHSNHPTPPRPRLTYRIGVVGHRPRKEESFDVELVCLRLTELFRQADTALLTAHTEVYTTDVVPSLVLISALAEGADQLAVQVFEESATSRTVARRLEAVIPFSRDTYAATFDDAAAQRALDVYLSRAQAVLELADWDLPPIPDAFAVHRRDRRFATVGELVMRQADLLIAVWNGQPARGPGGTAETVAAAISQGKPVVWISTETGEATLLDELPRYGDFFALVRDQAKTKPLSDKVLAGAINKVVEPLANGRTSLERLRSPTGDARTRLDGYLSREQVLDSSRWTTYDRRIVGLARRSVRAAEDRTAWQAGKRSPLQLRQQIRGTSKIKVDHMRDAVADVAWAGYPAGLDENAKDRLRSTIGEPWAAADAIATRLGHIYRSIYVQVFVWGALAVACGLFGLFLSTALKFNWAEPAFSLLELCCLGAACALYVVSHSRGHHTRWILSRALSEQFRAHWGLALLGLGGRRSLGPAALWNAWLFNAYVAEIGILNDRLTPGRLRAVARAIKQGIVEDQLAYHRRNHKHLREVHRILESWGGRLLIAASIASASLFVWASFDLWVAIRFTGIDALIGREGDADAAFRFLAVLTALLPAFGAAVAGIRYQGDFERFSERSEDTAKALERINAALADFIEAEAEDEVDQPLFETLRDLTTDLERVLLSDLEDWRFVYRARPIFSPE